MPNKRETLSNASLHDEEDLSFVETSQLQTILVDGAEAPQKKEKVDTGSLILIMLLVLALVGCVLYADSKQTQLQQAQDSFQLFSSKLDQVNQTSLLTLKGESKNWGVLKSRVNDMNQSWEELSTPYSFGEGVLSNISQLKIALNDLLNFEAPLADAFKQAGFDASTPTESTVNTDPDSMKLFVQTVKEGENKVQKIAAWSASIKEGLQTEQATVTQALQKQIQQVKMGALALGGLIILLTIVAIQKIKKSFAKNEGTLTTEREALRSSIDEWQKESEVLRQNAQERYVAAQRLNEANQAAILRLMNELQNIAEGDLTQQATVTEDITGAIADSVNYTIEELRSLVAQVQTATNQVATTTAVVEATSTDLLASSDEQLREIRETGQEVLDVANRITNVSEQAQESANVANQSLDAAEKGMLAVQNAIGGMNTIRDQIQDTSKRIKRLVESSQEIGEITDLIADITEQTNVLALNAAIQAASAGEAGRGFSIVAEEVQRLAERSASATRQIANLIKTIQGDMYDAVEAMERSTRDVVEGAKQTDETGTAFTEIDAVTRRLASMIQQISEKTQNEAKVASGVANSIQHIFAVTEQTAEGTRSSATQVRELARVSEQLERSVARFRIS